MASGLEILRDKRLVNGGISNVNCQGSEDDPHCLMEEFCCLYSEKLKAIDEAYPDSLEPKCQALTELVSDLSEQNFMLLKTVEELEKEALCRAEAFSNLAEATKGTMQQDNVRRGTDTNRSAQLEGKVIELQDALTQNEQKLSSCMLEIERLTQSLMDRKLEAEEVLTADGRMAELENMILDLQNDIGQKHNLIQSLQMENQQLQVETMDSNRRSQEINNQLSALKEELREKNELIEKCNNMAYSPTQETKLNLLDEPSRVSESPSKIRYLEDQLEGKERLLSKITEERNKLQHENQQLKLELSSLSKRDEESSLARVEELNKEIECLKCLLEENEQELHNKECKIRCELEEANYALNVDHQRLKEYEEQIHFLETALFSMQKCPGDDSKSIELFRCRIKCLQKEIEQKNLDIARYKNQEEKLKCELSQLRQYTNGIERQWEEKATYLDCEIEQKNILLEKYEKQLENMKYLAVYDQRSISKTKSDTTVAVSNKQVSLQSQHTLESFQECREYIQVINDLICNFEESKKNVSILWNDLQDYAKGNGDNMLVCLNEILNSFESSKNKMGDVIGYIEDVEGSKMNSLCYNLECLKVNILEISDSLSKFCLISDSSEADFMLEAGDAGVKKRLSTAINDSLSIIKVLENLKINSQTIDKERSISSENNHSGVVSLFKPIRDEKENSMKTLSALKEQQFEFSQKLIQKIEDFEEGFSSYTSSSESLRKETRKLFAIILAKEKQIQKQFDEIDNLKMALSSSKYVEEASEEIDSLRKVVSNKEIQLVEKQDLIQNLRCMNHSLRTRHLSHSTPSLLVKADSSDNVMEKSCELEEGLLHIKEKFSTLTSDIMKSKDKMIKFEFETKRLVEALTKIHEDIATAKETVSKNPEKLSTLDVSFTEAEYKVEELLHALEVFICAEQRDFKEFADSVSSYIEILLDIVEVIKKSINNEKLLTKALKDENNELKEQLCKLQNRLTASISQQTEICNELLAEEAGAYSKDELIHSLQEDLCQSNCYLEKIEEEYTALKLEKIEMEEKNQKVMEELQAKICKLQASLQNQAPEVGSLYQLSCIIEQQNQQICQNEIIEESLRREILCKEEEIKTSKSEIKAMKNRLNTVNCMFGELQVRYEKAKEFIAELQEDRSETEIEIKSLKNKLNALEAMYSDVKKKLECTNEHLAEYEDKLSEKEHECNEMKYQIDFQQRGLEKISQELREKSEQLNEIQLSEEMGNAAMNRQFQELKDLKEKLTNHWQEVSTKQKENLTGLIEENQHLKMENESFRNDLDANKCELCDVTAELVKSRQLIYQLNQEKNDFENEKSSLFYELENYKKELDELTTELRKSKQYILELNKEKCYLQNVIANLKQFVAQRKLSADQYNLNQEGFTKRILKEQEKFVEILLLKVCQLEKFLADKEEIINLLETQLKTSTMLMLDNLEQYDQSESTLSLAVNNVQGVTAATREAAYKMKLWQSLEINRKLVAMVNSLQHVNHALIQERT